MFETDHANHAKSTAKILRFCNICKSFLYLLMYGIFIANYRRYMRRCNSRLSWTGRWLYNIMY